MVLSDVIELVFFYLSLGCFKDITFKIFLQIFFCEVPGRLAKTTAKPSTSWSLVAASAANGVARCDATPRRLPELA